MTDVGADASREIEVWDRVTGGEPVSDLHGDRALADALRFLGHAEGDGLLSAVEREVEADRRCAALDLGDRLQEALRTALAYAAFGVRAEVEDGRLVLWPPETDAGWEMLQEIDQLLEHRYPTEDQP